MRRKVWRFESSLGHQHVVRSDPKKSEKPCKALCLRGFLFWVVRAVPVTSGVFTYVCQLRSNATPRRVEPKSESAFARNAKTGPKPYLLSNGQGLSLAHTSERRKDLLTPISPPRHVKETSLALGWTAGPAPSCQLHCAEQLRIGMARCALVDKPALRSAHRHHTGHGAVGWPRHPTIPRRKIFPSHLTDVRCRIRLVSSTNSYGPSIW
jgi:hypothetical protein